MSKALGMRGVWGLCGVLASIVAFAPVTRAEVSSDVSGSVLVFTKVVWSGLNVTSPSTPERDTVIQISNTSNNMVHAHCFYVNAQLVGGQPLWSVTDFAIWLTRQQPTHWVVSQGRPVNPGDGFGNDGSGIDPGAIPPVPEGFEGELKCIQVDASGTPFGGNNLKGEALIRNADGDVSKTNAWAILANPDLAAAEPTHELLLNNSVLNDGEYNACPYTWLFNHFADGTDDPVTESLNPIWCDDGECPIRTYLTMVPCSQDFENQVPSSVTVAFAIVNELEQPFSATITVDCWRNIRLADITSPTGRCTGNNAVCLNDNQCIDADQGFCNKNSIFSANVIGSGAVFTRITPSDAPGEPQGGVLVLGEQVTYNNLLVGGMQTTNQAFAGWNPQNIGNVYDATNELLGEPFTDVIRAPNLQ